MSPSLIKFGWIPYWNLLPLQMELTRLSGGSLRFQSGHPSAVNKWLMDGVVHIAPASSIALLKSRKLEMAFPIGIASEGPVQSVYIGLHREHQEFYEYVSFRQSQLRNDFAECLSLWQGDARKLAAELWKLCRGESPQISIPQLKLSGASAASSALTRVMLSLWLGASESQLLFESAAQQLSSRYQVDETLQCDLDCRSMELVIGDEALIRRHQFWKILDLGQVWHEMTNLPFVFGLWQTSLPTVPSGISSMVSEAAAIAQARMRIEPQDFLPTTPPLCGDGHKVDLMRYWKVIQYKLTERHLKSLLIYFALYQQIKAHDDDFATTERFVRWNQSWSCAPNLTQ